MLISGVQWDEGELVVLEMSRANIWDCQLNLLFLSSHRSIFNISGTYKEVSKQWDQAFWFRLDLLVKVKRLLSPQRQGAFAMVYTRKKNCCVLPGFTSAKSIGEHHPENAFFCPGYQFLDQAYLGLFSVGMNQTEFFPQIFQQCRIERMLEETLIHWCS